SYLYTHDDAGRLTSLVNYNDTTVTYGYDNAGRMTGLANKKSDNTVIASFAFTLDDNGNRTNITEDVSLSPVPTAMDISYEYNPERNRIESAGSTGFSHDLEGQLSDKGTKTFDFDSAHRLDTITGSSPASFTYDGANRRLSATRNGITTRYIYDPSGNLIATADTGNQIIAYFVYGQGLLAMINPSDQTFCYHFDGNANTHALTDSSQSIINQYAYTPFGMVIGEQETVPQPFKFVGQFGVMAEPDGLYYMRARYYDANTGRFISEDPIGFDGGDINLYGYVLNNPINKIDPLGLWSFWYGGS
ncbi:MAG: RHS repeat-associated core domain-containing protein, partial [Gammaproteobacteria bacterium]|nr:RHS repeat-associated core domain-containing protein [Gammaproteobacteria bacterium]